MNRRELRMLARERLRDARLLLKHGRYSAAYYLGGYVIECALKACVDKQIKRNDFPDKKFINDAYTHDLVKLLDLADLRPAFEEKRTSDPRFAVA